MYCQCSDCKAQRSKFYVRRNPDYEGYSPERDDYHPQRGDLFMDHLRGMIYIATSPNFLVTIDDNQELHVVRPYKKLYKQISVPLWQVPLSWNVSVEHYNHLMSNYPDLQLAGITTTERKIPFVIEDLEAGLPPSQVAEKHNIDLKTIKRHLTLMGRLDLYKKVRHKRVRRSKRSGERSSAGDTYKGDSFWNAVLTDIKSGISYNVVAEKYGMTTHAKRGTLFRKLKEQGLLEAVKLRDMPPKGSKGRDRPVATPSEWLQILTKIMGGMQIKDAIVGFDMVRSNVNSFLKKYGTTPSRIKIEGLPQELSDLLELAISIEGSVEKHY